MAEHPIYPHVFIEDAPSVGAIRAVPTSVTAFIGETDRGPVNEAVRVGSVADFQNQFGELNDRYPMSWSVYLFFLNLLCLPAPAGTYSPAQLGAASLFCQKHNAMLLIDPPPAWDNMDEHDAVETISANPVIAEGGTASSTAVYFPHVLVTGSTGAPLRLGPSGVVAGIVRPDRQHARGVEIAGRNAGRTRRDS